MEGLEGLGRVLKGSLNESARVGHIRVLCNVACGVMQHASQELIKKTKKKEKKVVEARCTQGQGYLGAWKLRTEGYLEVGSAQVP